MPNDRKFNPEIADKFRELTGQFFKRRREELSLTQSDLCKCAGLTQPQLSRFEEGNQNVTVNTLAALSECLRIKIEYEERDYNTPAGFEAIGKN
jgi:transcriptional regulator with XRE-family HTH domain